MELQAPSGAARAGTPSPDVLSIALRAQRHPRTALAGALAGLVAGRETKLAAAYLIEPSGAPVELLAAVGADAAQAGAPGPVDEATDGFVRARRKEGGLAPAGPATAGAWSLRECLVWASCPTSSGATLVAVADRRTVEALEGLRAGVGALALIAGAVLAERRESELVRELERLRQEHRLTSARLQHDLRSPLTGIVAGARTILEQHDRLADGDRRSLLEIVIQQGERMNRMITEALDRDADNAPRPRLVEVREVADRAARAATAGRPGRVEVAVGNLRVMTDPGRLERALLNLLDNALRHAPAGTVVHVLSEAGGGSLSLIVADRGTGVRPDVVPALFSAYATGNPAAGTGLGLHSVAEIARELGGCVTYTRQEGWTRFCLTIPDQRAAGDPPAGAPPVVVTSGASA